MNKLKEAFKQGFEKEAQEDWSWLETAGLVGAGAAAGAGAYPLTKRLMRSRPQSVITGSQGRTLAGSYPGNTGMGDLMSNLGNPATKVDDVSWRQTDDGVFFEAMSSKTDDVGRNLSMRGFIRNEDSLNIDDVLSKARGDFSGSQEKMLRRFAQKQ